MSGKFKVFRDGIGEWRFNLVAGNGEIIAVSEGYTSKQGCLNGIKSVKKNARSSIVFAKGIESKEILVGESYPKKEMVVKAKPEKEPEIIEEESNQASFRLPNNTVR